MKRIGEQKFYIQSSNSHLLNILDDNYYMELGVVNISVLNKLISHQSLDITQLIYYEILNTGIGQITHNPSADIHYQLNYLLSLRQKSSSNKFFLTCGTIAYFDELGVEKYAPLVLIPIEIDYRNGRISSSSTPRPNRLLLKLLATKFKSSTEEQNKFIETYSNAPLSNMGQIDKLLIDLSNETGYKCSPSNFLTVCKVEYYDFNLSNNFFNVERSIYETSSEEIIKKYFNTIHAILPTNIDQKYVILKADQGDTFAVDGRLGSGKTYTILNIIANAIKKNKKILYVNQDLDNVWDVEKNLRFLELGQYVYNLTKGLREINVPTVGLPPLSDQEFKIDDLEEISRFEKGLDEKVNGFTVRYILENLAILKNTYDDLIYIDIEEPLQKHEVDYLYNALKKVEEGLKEIGIYQNNIWKKLSISHNNFTVDEVIGRTTQLYELNDELAEKVKLFCDKYNLVYPRNVNDLDKMIGNAISFNSFKPLAIWQDKKIRTDAIIALSEIQHLSDNHYNATKYYESNVSNEYTPGSAEFILKDLCGKYFNISKGKLGDDYIYLDRLLNEKEKINELKEELRKVLENITESEHILSHIFEIPNFSQKLDIGYFKFLEKLSLFLSNNFIFNSWAGFAIDSMRNYRIAGEKVKTIYSEAEFYRNKFEKYLISKDDLEYHNIEQLNKNQLFNKNIRKYFDQKEIRKDKINISDLIQDVKDYYNNLHQAIPLIVEPNYKGSATIEQQIKCYINLYEFLSNLDEPYLEIMKKIFTKRMRQVEIDMHDINRAVSRFIEESNKLDNIDSTLGEYKIISNGQFGYAKKKELMHAHKYLNKLSSKIDELHKLFPYHLVITTRLLLELIDHDDIFLNANKVVLEKEEYYQSLLGNNYKEFDTIISDMGQTLDHFDEFIKRIKDGVELNSVFDNNVLTHLIEDAFELREITSEWFTYLRQFSVCFRGGQSHLQNNNLEKNSKILEKYAHSIHHVKHIFFINSILEKCKLYGLNTLVELIETSDTNINLAESYMYNTLVKVYNLALVKKPYILDFANYENMVEKYEMFEIDYCTRNIKALQKPEERRNKSRLANVKFDDYNKIVEILFKYVNLFLADINILNSGLNLEPFDLVIIDDGHLSSANKYNRLSEVKQCIVFGDKSFQSSIVNTLMQRMGEACIVPYHNRYIRMSSRFNNSWSIHNRYVYNFDTKITKQMLNSSVHFAITVVEFFEKNQSHIINVVVGSELTRRELYSKIITLLERTYSSSEIIQILCYNIRIINALNEGSRYVNDVMIYYNDFINLEHSQKELVFKNFVVVSNNIYVYYIGTKFDNQNAALLKDINNTIGKTLQNTKKISGISKLMYDKLLEKGVSVKPGFGYFDIIIDGESTVAIMIIGKSNDDDYSLLDEYRYYYREYQKNGWIVEILYTGDLINRFDETIEDLVELSKEIR